LVFQIMIKPVHNPVHAIDFMASFSVGMLFSRVENELCGHAFTLKCGK